MAIEYIYPTQKGLNLIAKAQGGARLEYTRAQIGEGLLPEGASITAMTALVSPLKYLRLATPVVSTNQIKLPIQFSSEGIGREFWWTEIGVWATDPDEGEILAAYGNAGSRELADHFAGGLEEFVFNCILRVANAASMSVVVDSSLAYVAISELANMTAGNALELGGKAAADYALAAELACTNTELGNKANQTELDSVVESKGKPGGIAVLDALGNPIGAMPSRLTHIIYVDGSQPIAHYDNLRNYITPGQRVLVATTTTAMSVDNCPEMAPGMMEVTEYNHDKNGNILSIMQRFTSQVSGITYTCIYVPANNYWSSWVTPIRCTSEDSGVYINLPGGMHICFGSQTFNNISVRNQANPTCYTSETLFFSGYPKTYRYAPRCLLSLSVGAAGPYWLAVDSNGPTTTRPQGFKLAMTTSGTISTVTLSYIAIGIS